MNRQRSLAGYSPWTRKESDTTEQPTQSPWSVIDPPTRPFCEQKQGRGNNDLNFPLSSGNLGRPAGDSQRHKHSGRSNLADYSAATNCAMNFFKRLIF